MPLYIFYSTSTYHQQNCNDTNSCVLLFIWIVDTWQCLSKASKRAQVGFLEATLEDYCDLLYISTHKRHFLHKLHHIEATTWWFHFHKFSNFSQQLLCTLPWLSFFYFNFLSKYTHPVCAIYLYFLYIITLILKKHGRENQEQGGGSIGLRFDGKNFPSQNQ